MAVVGGTMRLHKTWQRLGGVVGRRTRGNWCEIVSGIEAGLHEPRLVSICLGLLLLLLKHIVQHGLGEGDYMPVRKEHEPLVAIELVVVVEYRRCALVPVA